jgi:hypothetical protein
MPGPSTPLLVDRPRGLIALLLFALVVVAMPGTGHAEPTTAPGEESGRIDGADEVPKLAVRAALAPVEGAIWLTERYQLSERLHRLLWNDRNTLGVLPMASLEAGFGINLGAHLVAHDVFGHGERIDLRASGGGRVFLEGDGSTIAELRTRRHALDLPMFVHLARRDGALRVIGIWREPGRAR